MENLPFTKDGLILNAPVFTAEQAKRLMELTHGHLLPAVSAHDFGFRHGLELVKKLKQVTPVVSVALGGGGNVQAWETALNIANRGNAGHLNQPLVTAPYAQGLLTNQLVNGILILEPNGNLLATYLNGSPALSLTPNAAGQLLSDMQLNSLKLLGVGKVSLPVFKDTVQNLGNPEYLELAGGLNLKNISGYIKAATDAGFKVIPHVFGAMANFETMSLDYSKARAFVEKLNLI